jgi:hypothetical protein
MYPINIDASYVHQKSWEQGYNLVLISAMGFLMDFRSAIRRVRGDQNNARFPDGGRMACGAAAIISREVPTLMLSRCCRRVCAHYRGMWVLARFW